MHHTRNQLLAMLSREDLAQLEPHLSVVKLEFGTVLAEPNQKLDRIFFPHTGIASYMVQLRNGQAIETGMIGRDGVIGASEATDDSETINRIVIQATGTASAISSARMSAALDDNPALRKLFGRFAQFFLAHVQQTAACNADHHVEARACRWLLRMHELVGQDIPLTQEFLAQMLGVRRTSVSLVAGKLQEAGLIRYRRGNISIENLPRMHEASCECYGAVRDRYVEMFGVRPGMAAVDDPPP